MTMRLFCLLVCLAATLACGSREVAGSLEDHEASETGTTQSPEASGDTDLSEVSAETMGVGSGFTGIGTTDTGTTVQGSEMTDPSTSATDAAGATEHSTGEPAAVCGNGALEVFGLVPEECDDGNLDPDDGCSDTCSLDLRVFVTSALYNGADIESLNVANALCANRADDQGWPDALKYRAWLSDSTTDARDRFKQGRGRLLMANGLVFATSWSALLAGQLENPLMVTEKSETYQGGVWTGTRPDGTAVPGAEHCDNWSSSSVLKKGYYGYSDRMTAEWTMAEGVDQPSSCPSDYASTAFRACDPDAWAASPHLPFSSARLAGACVSGAGGTSRGRYRNPGPQ